MRDMRRNIWRDVPDIVLRNSADREDHRQIFPVIGFIKIEPSGSFFFIRELNIFYYEIKGGFKMITFILLAIILIALGIFTVVTAGAVGTAGIIVFGDVIVCIVLIVWIIKRLINRKD